MVSKKWLRNYFKPKQETVLGISTDHDLHTENPPGKAVIWATSQVTWNTPPEHSKDDDAVMLRGEVTGDRGQVLHRIEKVITGKEAKGIDTMIGFYMTDALNCEYGFGVFFGKGNANVVTKEGKETSGRMGQRDPEQQIDSPTARRFGRW